MIKLTPDHRYWEIIQAAMKAEPEFWIVPNSFMKKLRLVES
jgi:hypothetical protein